MSRSAWMFVSAVFEQNCSSDVAVAETRVERVVGKLLHRDEPRRPDFLQVRSGRRTATRRARRSRSSCRGTRSARAGLSRAAGISGPGSAASPALHEKGDALGQSSKQPLEPGAILRQHVEARDQRGGRLRRDHARLMQAIEGLSDPACRHRRAPAFRPASPGPESRAPSRWRRSPNPSKRSRRPACGPPPLPSGREEADGSVRPP